MYAFTKTLAVLLFLSTAAAGANPYVACVQEMMSRHDIDAGPVDGKLGFRTVIALSRLSDGSGLLAELPAITGGNAAIWCRWTGLYYEDFEPWPSSDRRFTFNFDEAMPELQTVLINLAANRAMDYYRDRYDLRIPGTLRIVGAPTVERLALAVSQELDVPEQTDRIREFLRGYCGEMEIGGVAYGGVIALCFDATLSEPSLWTRERRRDMQKLLTHEFAHEIQAQLVGVNKSDRDQPRYQVWGPKWLVEGAAMAFHMDHGEPDISLTRRLDAFDRTQEYDGNLLRGMVGQSATDHPEFARYASRAATMLAASSGHKAFLTFWDYTPLLGWEAAFEKAFGLTVEAFYDRF